MQPIFTMQYGEFRVADYLSKKLKCSVFIPPSSQEKGIDLLLYRYKDKCSEIITVQVKTSRTYYHNEKTKNKDKVKYPYSLMFNRFKIQENADWYILVGIKPTENINISKGKNNHWSEIMLAFNNKEMSDFMEEVKLKDTDTEDTKFAFWFNTENNIIQARGFPEKRDMSKFLIDEKKRIEEIEKSFRIHKKDDNK